MNSIKKIVATLAALSLIGTTLAGNTTTQNVSFTVAAVAEISVSGNPGAMAIVAPAAGSTLSSVTDATTSYAITTNQTGQKITAAIDSAMPSGVTLTVGMQAPTGATASTVTLGTVAGDAVTGISQLSASNLTITYTLSAELSAGDVSGSRTVTFTVMGL